VKGRKLLQRLIELFYLLENCYKYILKVIDKFMFEGNVLGKKTRKWVVDITTALLEVTKKYAKYSSETFLRQYPYHLSARTDRALILHTLVQITLEYIPLEALDPPHSPTAYEEEMIRNIDDIQKFMLLLAEGARRAMGHKSLKLVAQGPIPHFGGSKEYEFSEPYSGTSGEYQFSSPFVRVSSDGYEFSLSFVGVSSDEYEFS
jgi:hypothetical protein